MEIPLTLTARDHSGKSTKDTDNAATLIYSIPLWYRIVTMTILTVIIIANATGFNEPGWKPSIPGMLFLLVSLIAAFYEECWVFDSAGRQIKTRLGLMFLAKKYRYGFDEIVDARVDIFIKGKLDQSNPPPESKMPRTAMARLVIELANGQNLMINNTSWRNKKKLEDTARAMCKICGVKKPQS